MSSRPVLILPGYADSGPEHWQSHWERADSRCRRVIQRDWLEPRLDDWLVALDRAIAECETPPVLAAHSLGCLLAVHRTLRSPDAAARPVKAALLVAPPDFETVEPPEEIQGFHPLPRGRLPFPSIVVASTDDPFTTLPRARAAAEGWGSRLVTLEGAGHINADSGFGPWPEGRKLLAELSQ